MQLSDQHGSFPEAVKPGQLRPVTGRIFLATEHAHLPGSVTKLHDMAAAVKTWQRAAEVEFNKVTASAAECQMKRGCIQQKQIAGFHRAGKKIVIQRGSFAAFNEHPEFAYPVTRLNRTDYADLMTDHLVK